MRMTGFLLFSFLLIGFGCKDNPVESIPKPVYGIGGKIITSDGQPISGVKIYCLYYKWSVPPDYSPSNALKKTSDTSGFLFDFREILPTPASNSFYVRFSVPEQCAISLTLISKSDGSSKTILSENFGYGFYQRYFNKIVETMQLRNGVYRFVLSATGVSGKQYLAEKDLLIISDSGSPNALSAGNGAFTVPFNDAAVGDSVTIHEYDWNTFRMVLSDKSYILIHKDGFYDQVFQVQFIKNTLISRDIILEKKP